MTKLIESAVASQIPTLEFALNVLDAHPQSSGDQVVPIATDRLGSTDVQPVRVPPLRRPRDHDSTARQPRSFSARALETTRHDEMQLAHFDHPGSTRRWATNGHRYDVAATDKIRL